MYELRYNDSDDLHRLYLAMARLTKQYSRIGRILDGVSGDFWFIAIYFALVFREINFGDKLLGADFFANHQWVIWVLAVTERV